MAVVAVDGRGRMTIPREYKIRNGRATIIPAGPFLIIIPIPTRPLEASGTWLASKLHRKELKALAERAARSDAVRRSKRRKQL